MRAAAAETPVIGRAANWEAAAPRIRISLDDDWRFTEDDDPAMAQAGYDDHRWRAVQIPHTWNARDGQDGGGDYRRGSAWYRRHFSAGAPLAGHRLYLEFDGVSLMADVYVNGVHLGTHQGGFARFRFDATDAIRIGGDNVLAVRVDNDTHGFIPLGGDATLFGGIYRSVSLLATNQVQISTTDYGSSGVYVLQDRIGSASADLTVVTELENYEEKARLVEVEATVTDAAGAVVAHSSVKHRVNPGDSLETRQPIAIQHPHFWNAQSDPYEYTTTVTVKVDRTVRDRIQQPLGLRTLRADPVLGFLLNGKPFDLHGVSRHQDRQDKGWAISAEDDAADFGFVREIGCTAVRLAGGQQAASWYDWCDRAGIVVWTEIPFTGDALSAPSFMANAKQQLRELIRQNFNHPSIAFWGIGSEAVGDRANKVLAELAFEAKSEDVTRIATYASDSDDKEPGNWYSDAVGFNDYFGWYSGSASDFGPALDAVHSRHPTSPIGLGEFGAGASAFQHADPPGRPVARSTRHPEEYQALLHEKAWMAIRDRPYLWGKFIWCLFDFASDSRAEGDHPGRNDKGLVTYDRNIRKDAFFWYKANWNAEPMVHITDQRFTPRSAAEAEIKVYSNAVQVEATLNGVSLGTVSAPDHIFRWTGLKLVPGDNHITARAVVGGHAVEDACSWTLRQPAP